MKLFSATLVIVLGCGTRDEVPPSEQVAPEPITDEPPRPAPGADLDGPIAVPDAHADTRTRMPGVVDLMTDRAIVKVDVPTPPRGGAVKFTYADNRRAWVTRIPDSQQLPSVTYAHDKIYVSGGFDSVSFYALHAESGQVAWATSNLEDNGPTAAVVDGDDVLFNTESCTLFNLDAHTGKRNWYLYLGDPTLGQIAVTQGLVYAAYPDGYGQSLGAYKVKTGKQVWSRAIGSELLATPVIAGDSVYVSTIGGDTYRIDHRTGRVKWKKHLRATTAPWIAGEEMFVSRRGKKGREQQVVVSVANGAVLREHAVASGGYTADVPTNLDNWKTVWAFEGSRPVVERGIRYVAMGNEVHASDATTGEALWTRRYPGSADRRALGSVALAGAALVVSSRDGKLFGLDVDTGYTLWSYDVGKQIAAEPIIAKGWLYAATVDGYVVALDVADPSLDGWHMFGGNAQKNGPVLPSATPPPLEGAMPATTAQATPIDTAIASAQRSIDDEVKRQKAVDEALARQKAAIEAAKRDRHKPIIIDENCKANPLC